MAKAPNPVENEDLFTSITLGGVRSPGIVTLSGHDRAANWDVKAGNGQSGGTTTLKDIPTIAFSATFSLLVDISSGIDEATEWVEFQRLIDSTIAGPKPKALDIYHPDLAANDIRSVVKAKVGGKVHDGKGGQSVVVTFQEYRPPKPKKGGTPNGSGSKKGTATDPNAAALAELDALVKKFQTTPWG